MKWSLWIVMLALPVPQASAGGPVDPFASRTWSDNTHSYSVQASLFKVDHNTGFVQLDLGSGERIDVALRRLSRQDVEFINSLPHAQPGETVNVAGLEWYEELGDAQVIARRRPGPDDDKPILCFRVLGEIEGFM